MNKEDKLFDLLEMLENVQVLLHDVVNKLKEIIK
tara:strand:- start:1841 stop:1942 length:102 start_codon:yes stop_codon:yes gene_type:complete